MPADRLSFATTIAEEAGRLARELRADPSRLEVSIKGPMDLVTAADHEVEALLRERITGAYPGAAILGEEQGRQGDGHACWIVDPIDGTVNFARGMPEWAISIAYFDGEALTHGVIHAPDLGLTASAQIGGEARLNGTAIHLDQRDVPLSPMVALGYSPHGQLSDYLGRIETLLAEGIEHRRHGAATIGFLGVLAGWFDAYHEQVLNIWDAAAGLVLIEAAGGVSRHDPLDSFLVRPSKVLTETGKVIGLADILD
jgi:myo-inositol-1(or 4)-monophosphatase